MKKILIITLLLVFGWTGSTWFIGNETETFLKNYLKNSKNVYAEMGMESNFEIKDYKKSFWKSTAKTVFSLKTGDPEIDGLFKNLQFNNIITHGPLLWVNGKPSFGTANIYSTLDMESLELETQDVLKNIFADTNPMTVSITFGINDTANYEFIIPTIEIKESDELQFKIEDGIYLSGTVNKNTLIGTAKGTLGTIDVKDSGLLVKTSASTIDIDMQGIIAGQMLGTSRFTTPSIKIEGETIPSVSFGIEFASDTKKAGEEGLDSSIQLVASDIKAPIEVSSINLSTTLKDIQIKGLEQLATIQKDIQGLQSSGFDSSMSDEEHEALLNKIQNLPNIMVAAIQNSLKQNKTAINIKVDVASQKGNALLDINSHYIGNGADINLEELSTKGLSALLKIMTAKIDFNSPKAMLAGTPAAFLMPSLIEQGVIAEKSDSYHLNAIFKADAMTLNDKPISVDEFAQLLEILGLGGSDNELPEREEFEEPDPSAELPPALLELLEKKTEDVASEIDLEATVEQVTEEPMQQEKSD